MESSSAGLKHAPRIRAVLRKAGLEELPDDDRAPLADYGMDSLIFALTVLELEKEFATRLPAAGITREDFETIASIHALLERRLG